MTETGKTKAETAVRFERLVPGPIERVWNYLTQGDQIARWFGGPVEKYTMEPRVGGVISFGDDHIRGVVTQWKPPKVLAYTWNVFSPGEFESPYPESYVQFELEQKGKDILLILTHRPIPDDFQPQTMMGWHTFLDRLMALLRGDEPETRETLMERNRVLYGVTAIKR